LGPPPLPPTSAPAVLPLAATALAAPPALAAPSPGPPPLPAFVDTALATAVSSAAPPPAPAAPVDAFARTMGAVTAPLPPDAPPGDERISLGAFRSFSFLDRISLGRFRSFSFLDRLRAPTPFRRKPWLAAWIALGVVGFVLVLWLSLSSPHPPAAAGTAPQPSVAVVPSLRDPAPPPRTTAPAIAPTLSEAPSTLPAPVDKPRPPPGFGFLMVHSAAPWANVYVSLVKYGRAEGMLTVPCGKRFVSIGVPTRKGREPIWLAPGEMTMIPCGGLLEMTMDPRKVR
jgi:hypothetical protein